MTVRPGSLVINCADIDRLVALGAKFVRHVEDPEDDYVVLADPEGNLLCVCLVVPRT